MAHGVPKHPAWNLVLSYELEVRKRAYSLRDGKHSSLQEALEEAWNSAELINQHFLLPLTASADFFSTASHGEVSTAHAKGNGKHGKGKGKGKDRRFGFQAVPQNQIGRGQKALLPIQQWHVQGEALFFSPCLPNLPWRRPWQEGLP